MRRARKCPALWEIGRLLIPAAKLEAAPLKPVMDLRDGKGAVPRVQQRVGERIRLTEILRSLFDARDWMVGGERTDDRGEVPQLPRVSANPEQPAVVLHHGDAGATVSAVHHHMHRAVGGKDIAQRPQPCVRVGEVVQHARANDLIECLAELADALDLKSMEIEIAKAMLFLKTARMAQTGFTDVDRRHIGVRLGERILCGL